MITKRVLLIALLASVVLLTVGITPQAASIAGSPIGYWWFPISEINQDPVNHANQVNPAVAYNNQREEYLVVWQNEWTSNKDIYGRIVPKEGAPTSAWFPISPAGYNRYNPAVAYSNKLDQYLVVYESSFDVFGQRLSATGQQLGGEITIAGGGIGSYGGSAVAYADTADRYLAVFRYADSGGSSIQARAYKGDGTADGAAFPITSHTTAFPEQPDLVYNHARDEFLVVWQQLWAVDDHDVYGRRVTMTGGASAPDPAFPILNSSDDELTPAIAAVPKPANVGQYLVVCEREGNIYGQRVTGSGTLDGSTIPISTLAGFPESKPTVAGSNQSARSEYLVAWRYEHTDESIGAREVSTDGSLLGSFTVLYAWYADNPDLASGPLSDYLLVTDDVLMSDFTDVFGKRWGNRIYLPLVIRNI